MPVGLLVVLGLLVAALVFPGDAWAHGGAFLPPRPPESPPKPPPKPPPPPPKEPLPATPPEDAPPAETPPDEPEEETPEPESPPPETTETEPDPTSPVEAPPPPSAPLAPPPTVTGGVPTGTRGGTARARGVKSVSMEDAWETWWTLNRLGFLPDRTSGLRHLPTTPRAGDGDARTLFADRRVFVAKRHVAPFLRTLVSREDVRDDVVGSALIALGKICTLADDPDLFVQELQDPRAAPIVRESAALALGLLARSAPDLQRPAGELDGLRAHLLTAVGDGHMPYRARVFSAVALGLLGDQPFPQPYAKDGRLVIRALWGELERHHAHRGLNVALLTALGMQPPEGVSGGILEDLRRIVAGRRVLKRTWDSVERSHALTAVLQLGGAGAHADLRRVLARRREHVDVRRAAYLAVGRLAERQTPEQRVELASVVLDALRRGRDPLTTGLGELAAAHLLAADLRTGSWKVLHGTRVADTLLTRAERGPTNRRSFTALALGVAVHRVDPAEAEERKFVEKARAALQRLLANGRGDDRLRAAYAVAVGIAGIEEADVLLSEIVEDRHSSPELRGHAAVALGQVGARRAHAQRPLFVALSQRRSIELRRQAALGLALLGGRVANTKLLSELETATTERHLAQVVVAVGRLGDLQTVPPLLRHAADRGQSELAQALAVVALGLIADPEPRPVLLRLTQNANYPARTSAMQEAYSIL